MKIHMRKDRERKREREREREREKGGLCYQELTYLFKGKRNTHI